MIDYIPKQFDYPKVIEVTSAWEPLAPVIKDIITQFKLKRRIALEFGVERGYSTSALANYFKTVLGVDPFNWVFGDGADRSYDAVKEGLKEFPNIYLYNQMSDEFIKLNPVSARYDLIHIDIGYETHCYETTFPSAKWAVQHSNCVLLHDIFSFPEINQVCEELSAEYGFDYYGYREPMGPAGIVCGLGILIKRK
jgi:hypothetical protein